MKKPEIVINKYIRTEDGDLKIGENINCTYRGKHNTYTCSGTIKDILPDSIVLHYVTLDEDYILEGEMFLKISRVSDLKLDPLPF